jgi:hypothetical protein
MKQPHYLRVVRALALAAIVPGCTSADPAPTSEPPIVAEADAEPAAHDDVQVEGDAAVAASEVDAGLPFSSGPIVPPELPESFA